jgi:hypothetical protein
MTDPFERAVMREELAEYSTFVEQCRAGLLIHAVVYAAVNVLLIVVNALTWSGYPWFVYPLLGWGIGLAAHAASYRNQVHRQRRLEAKVGLA